MKKINKFFNNSMKKILNIYLPFELLPDLSKFIILLVRWELLDLLEDFSPKLDPDFE